MNGRLICAALLPIIVFCIPVPASPMPDAVCWSINSGQPLDPELWRGADPVAVLKSCDEYAREYGLVGEQTFTFLKRYYMVVEQSAKPVVAEYIARNALELTEQSAFYSNLVAIKSDHVSDAMRRQIVERVLSGVGENTTVDSLGQVEIGLIAKFGFEAERGMLASWRNAAWSADAAGDGSWYRSKLWTVSLALARHGDAGEVDFVLSLARQHPDDYTRFTAIFRDLSGIRSMKVADYFAEHLEDRRRVERGNEAYDVPVGTVRYHAATLLREMLVGFPDEADADAQRTWLNAHRADPPWR